VNFGEEDYDDDYAYNYGKENFNDELVGNFTAVNFAVNEIKKEVTYKRYKKSFLSNN
jgi:hypothetical protein